MNKIQYIKQQKQHIKNMEKIVKAIEPYIINDKSTDFNDGWNAPDRIKAAYKSAQFEIESAQEKIVSA